ncbi:hypothetical protein CGRA01v4_08729 [Colletotrichum graminicola]|uniref:Uncharacterized protein n=1 Tax=Colletotrichum graminicola (strain M1.001 / M2 / FGSC 10212) TaxID=645133 RepID=E3QQT0_COLGM|nr:uncharacterized protein GLRG_08362 [Colletotrichum graminicola M1.001]EFQ33218.1 hypothetical protein GLRG_08362 [Colletotrichum graminicola M1.001]WDK17446.1 hypothetical protein CGRA01v4_08729 [Colletotrichum graminicola]
MTEPGSAATAHAAPNNRPRTRQRMPKAAPSLDPNVDTVRFTASSPPLPCPAPPPSHSISADLGETGERKRQSRLGRENSSHVDVPERRVSETDADSDLPGAAPSFVLETGGPIEQVADKVRPLASEVDGATAGFNLDASAVRSTDPSDSDSISDLLAVAAALPSTPSTVDPALLMERSSLSPPDFPDSYLLPMSDLKVLKGLLRIATRLGSYSVMWDPAATSPFNLGTGTAVDLLPETWRPTASQVLLPHHPIMDFLPWPEVRDRVINLFSLPDEARPPAARGQLGLVNFAYDLEDSGEGARIWGAGPYDASSWEVGQVLFERW